MPKSKFKKYKITKPSEMETKAPKVKATKAKAGGASGGASGSSGGTSSKSTRRISPQRQQEIDSLHSYLEDRVRHANEVAEMYSDYESVQSVFQNARRTLPIQRRGDADLFSSDIKTEKAMMREIARIDVFEGDIRIRKDDNIAELIRSGVSERQINLIDDARKGFYKDAFGGQWMSKNKDHETYDKSRISGDYANRAFEIYKNLVEEKQSEEYIKMLWSRTGRLSYDSENMIIEIYDMISMGYKTSDIYDRVRESLNKLAEEYAEKQFDDPMDYGKLPSKSTRRG